jgi:hypothetical protein
MYNVIIFLHLLENVQKNEGGGVYVFQTSKK